MDDQQDYIDALIELHLGLERLGPGDDDFSNRVLSLIPALPENPRIADIGCGTGVGALFLAERLNTKVRAVDFARQFLDELEDRAKLRGLENLVEAVEGDMGSLDWQPASIDLLWSEGAAYNLTFAGALQTWRPLLAPKGIVVVSEMNYFTDVVPPRLREYMQSAYPTIGTEAENRVLAGSAGFETLGIHRLPSYAWWKNYYGPLKERMASLKSSADALMRAVIHDTEEEMNIFQEYEAQYGYSFYIMTSS